MAPRTTAVSAGRVTRIVDTEQIARKRKFCSQRLESRRGQRRLKLPELSVRETSARGRTLTSRRRASHSPRNGNGQSRHQTRPPSGTMKMMSRNHHRIQTMVTMMLRLPMGDP